MLSFYITSGGNISSVWSSVSCPIKFFAVSSHVLGGSQPTLTLVPIGRSLDDVIPDRKPDTLNGALSTLKTTHAYDSASQTLLVRPLGLYK